MLTESSLKTIAAKAEPLHERISNGHHPQSFDSSRVDEIMDQWSQQMNEGNYDWFDERLNSLDTDEKEVRGYLMNDKWPALEPLPAWTESLQQLTSAISNLDTNSLPQRLDSSETPFGPLFAPFVEWGKSQFDLLKLDSYLGLSLTAKSDFDDWLESQLSQISARALHLDYGRYLAQIDQVEILESTSYRDSTDYLTGYLTSLSKGRMGAFFTEFAVLGKVIIKLIQNWATTVTNFCRHLSRDRESLCSEFGIQRDSAIEGIEPGAGDLHDCGQAVCLLEFESGESVVYKPRDVSPEANLYSLCDTIAQRLDIDYLEINLVEREDHGWVEWLENRPVTTVDAVVEYYYRTGVLLSILYILNGGDCHFENLRSVGEYPVLIDGETVPTQNMPQSFIPNSEYGKQILATSINQSVLKTGMLEYRQGNRDSDVPDISGLSADESVSALNHKVAWEGVNSDGMEATYQPGYYQSSTNLPKFEGDSISPEQYSAEIAQGFEHAYREIQQSAQLQDEIRAAATDDFELRVLIRATEVYDAAVQTISSPECLRNAAVRRIRLDILLKILWDTYPNYPNKVIDLYLAETEAVCQANVPRFTTTPRSYALRCQDDVIIDDFYDDTIQTIVSNRLSNLSRDDLQKEVDILTRSLSDAGD